MKSYFPIVDALGHLGLISRTNCQGLMGGSVPRGSLVLAENHANKCPTFTRLGTFKTPLGLFEAVTVLPEIHADESQVA